MQSHDDVVSSWLKGSDPASPAGPLFLHDDPLMANVAGPALTGVTTSSCIQRGCECC